MTRRTHHIFDYGRIAFGGRAVGFEELRRASGFVLERDSEVACFAPALTVRETLQMAADLRMVGGISATSSSSVSSPSASATPANGAKATPSAQGRIADFLSTFNLSGVEFSRVATISDTQRRSLTCATELIDEPQIVYLDSIIQGLDSFGAMRILHAVRTIAQRSNMIVVVSLNQSSMEVFRFFDRVYCMRKGQVFLGGLVNRAAEVFLEMLLLEEEDSDKAQTQSEDRVAQEELKDQKARTVSGFLEEQLRRPVPMKQSLVDWVLFLAQAVDDEEGAEGVKKTRRIFEKFERKSGGGGMDPIENGILRVESQSSGAEELVAVTDAATTEEEIHFERVFTPEDKRRPYMLVPTTKRIAPDSTPLMSRTSSSTKGAPATLRSRRMPPLYSVQLPALIRREFRTLTRNREAMRVRFIVPLVHIALFSAVFLHVGRQVGAAHSYRWTTHSS